MKQIVCNYAPVRFLPYRETGEFVNVGVVASCPQIGFFGYKLSPVRRTRRLANFFPELDLRIFKSALKGIERELQRVEAEHQVFATAQQLPIEVAKAQMDRFATLIAKREGLLFFGKPGTLLAASAPAAVQELYARFIERQFAEKPEYQEIIMRNRLADWLRDWKLSHFYQTNEQIGDDDFHVKMPFVHYVGQKPDKVIKPLDLNKPEASDVYLHGGTWVKNMERLKARGTLPNNVIFTISFPSDEKPFNAAKEIEKELAAAGVLPIDFNNETQVRAAANVTH